MLMNTATIPIAAYAQNEENDGRLEKVPIPNARKSVTDVMVIATPECFIARPTRSSKGNLKSL